MFSGHTLSKFVLRNSGMIVILAVLLSIVGGYYSSKLTLESNLAELLPDSFESVQALNRMKEEVGGVGNLRIVLESNDYNALIKFAQALVPRLQESPSVNYVDYKNDVQFYKRNALLLLDMDELDSLHTAVEDKIEEEKQKLNPLFVDDLFADDEPASGDALADWEEKYKDKLPTKYYTNDDSTVMVIKIYPSESNTSLDFVASMVKEVQGIVAGANPTQYAQDLQVYYGGNFKNRLDEYELVKSDIMGTAIYGFGGVFLLIIIYFRRFTGAVLITITLIFSLAWTFGVTYVVIGNLNTITGFLFVILFGLGIDYGIHAFARYSEGRRKGMSYEQAIEKMVSQTGKALTTTAVTTSAAFFSLILMDFKGFSDLGFISGVGVLFALVAMVVVLPALIKLLEGRNLLKFQKQSGRRFKFVRGEFKFARPLLVAAVAITLFAGYSVMQVSFQYDFTELRAITEERQKVGEKTRGVFDLSESPAVVLVDSKQEIDGVVETLRKIKRQDTESPTIDLVRSVYSLVPPNQLEKLARIKEIRELVDQEAEGVFTGKDKERLDEFREYLAVDESFTWEDFPEKDKRQFINKEGKIGNFVFIYPSVALRDGKNAIAFRNDVGTFETESGKVYHASSSNIILADMLTILVSEGKWAVALTFLVVFTIVWIDFRSLKSAALVLTPLTLGVLWVTVAMYFLGLKWNLFNIVVIPSIIGIGVDNGVHIYHRYKEEGPGSLIYVLKTTGVAILMTTLTTMVGYSGLVVAHHPGLNSIGELALIGLGLTFLTAILVLPAALQFLENRRTRVTQQRPAKIAA